MEKDIIRQVKTVTPDLNKIIYCADLYKSGKVGLVKEEEMLGMFAYILLRGEIYKYPKELSKLAYIVNKAYGIDSYKMVRDAKLNSK